MVIVDAAPSLGGQAIGSIIGTIIGLYTHGPAPYQITHGIADDLIADLTAEGSLHRRVSMTGTITFQYDEVRLAPLDRAAGRSRRHPGRWSARCMTGVDVRGRAACAHIELATRFGAVRVEAHGLRGRLRRREPDATRPDSRCASRMPRSTAR